MLRLASGASNFADENAISSGIHDGSVVVGGGPLVSRLPGSVPEGGLGVGVGWGGAGLLLPKPTKVHHKNRIATRPSATAAISFFFSLALLRSIACITTYPEWECCRQ